MNKQKLRQKTHRKAKRNIQNQRTFANVQERRNKHLKNHPGTTIEAVRWVNRPTAKP